MNTIVTSIHVLRVLGHVQRGLELKLTFVTVYLPRIMSAKAIDLLKEDISVSVCVSVKAEQIIYSDIVETLANGKHLLT